MLRAKRLEKLEADTLTAWRAAWERNALTFVGHMGGLDVAPADLYYRLKAKQPHLSGDEIDNACELFLQSIDVRQFTVFAAWFKSYELPDLDVARPALSLWPSDIPMPLRSCPANGIECCPTRLRRTL